MFARPSDDIKQLSTESLSGGVNQKLSFSRRVLDFIRQNGVLIGMILVLIVFQTIEHKFFAVKNLLNVLNQSSLLIIMSTGMMMAMSVRAVDLSIAQVADASGLLAALLLIGKYPTWVVFLVPLLFGAFVGLVNCLLVSYLGVPAIIATLGSMFIIRSMELTLTNGAEAQILFTLPKKITKVFLFLGTGSVGPIPFLILFTLIVIAIAAFIRHKTVMGREMDAIGGNVKTAYLSGINIRKVFGLAFIIGSVLSAISGVALTSRTGSAVPRSVEGYLMECFVSVYLGVILSKRNKMNVVGTVVGALFVSLISNWITLMGLGAPYKYAINGMIILIALSIGAMRRSENKA